MAGCPEDLPISPAAIARFRVSITWNEPSEDKEEPCHLCCYKQEQIKVQFHRLVFFPSAAKGFPHSFINAGSQCRQRYQYCFLEPNPKRKIRSTAVNKELQHTLLNTNKFNDCLQKGSRGIHLLVPIANMPVTGFTTTT